MSPDELQLQASDPKHSVWVSASAGAGKTTVLTNRVLRLLLDGNAPGKIICITYTKIAAAEMLARIGKRLAKWMVCSESELVQDLSLLCGKAPDEETLHKARLLFLQLQEAEPGLQVQTIHSFCQSLLERFPLEASVTPGFSVLDDNLQKELLRECKMELYTRLLSADEKLLSVAAKSISRWGEFGADKVLDLIIAERTLLEEWLYHVDDSMLMDLRETILNYDRDIAQCKNKISQFINQHNDLLVAACDYLQTGLNSDVKRAEILRIVVRNSEDVLAIEAACKSLLDEKDLKPKVKLITKNLSEKNPATDVLLQRFALHLAEYAEEARMIRALVDSAVVAIIAHALLSLYHRHKRERSVLDYDDLIHESLRLLDNRNVLPWVLFKLDGAIDHLLLDEAQDTSPEQWRLVRIIVREFVASAGDADRRRSFFVVGDKKQSIYSFQGADPHEYVAMQHELEALCAMYNYAFVEVPLNVSFRSTQAVLDSVDLALSGEDALRGVLSKERLQHIPYRKTAIGRVELWPAAHSRKMQFQEWQLPDSMALSQRGDALLAQRITLAIQHWLQTGRKLSSGKQNIEPRDILILMRRRSPLMHMLTRLLKDRGIPVSGLDRLVLSDHLAVQDMLSLAAFLLNPDDDLSLCEILKSPLFGLDDAALIKICAGREVLSVWQRLQAEKDFAQAVFLLQDWLAKTDFHTPYELYSHVLYDCGGKKSYDARMGEEAVEVLGIFLSGLLEYEDAHPTEASLQHMLEWMRGSRQEVKREMEEAGNVVRIMTVHGAKGLEAPIVILPDTAGLPNFKHTMLHVDEAGKLWFLRSQKTTPSSLRPILQAERARAMEEYHRLLYVAMTRAKDELYIAGVKPAQQKIPEESWYETVRAAFASDVGTEQVKWHEAYPMLPLEAEGEAILFRRTNPGEVENPKTTNDVVTKVEATPTFLFAPPATMEVAPVFENPSRMFRSRENFASGAAKQAAMQKAAERGNLIHRILELMPVGDEASRARFVKHYLGAYVPEWSDESRKQVAEEIIGLLKHPEMSLLFGAEAMAEVPVLGSLPDGRRFSAQIDRLHIGEGEVLLVDFKTGAVPAEKDIPESYRIQMDTYRRLMRPIYPDKTIKCMLVYTAGPELFTLENSV